MQQRDRSASRESPGSSRDADRDVPEVWAVEAASGDSEAEAVVSASVDAVFERYEEESPEEVMLADRRAAESEVVPAPPGFEEFAVAVADADVPDADGERSLADLDLSPRDFDGVAWSTLDVAARGDEGRDGFEWVGDGTVAVEEDGGASGSSAVPSEEEAADAPAGVLSWLRSSLGL